MDEGLKKVRLGEVKCREKRMCLEMRCREMRIENNLVLKYNYWN